MRPAKLPVDKISDYLRASVAVAETAERERVMLLIREAMLSKEQDANGMVKVSPLVLSDVFAALAASAPFPQGDPRANDYAGMSDWGAGLIVAHRLEFDRIKDYIVTLERALAAARAENK